MTFWHICLEYKFFDCTKEEDQASDRMWKCLKPAFFLMASRGATLLVAKRIQDFIGVWHRQTNLQIQISPEPLSSLSFSVGRCHQAQTKMPLTQSERPTTNQANGMCDVVTEKCKQTIACRDELWWCSSDVSEHTYIFTYCGSEWPRPSRSPQAAAMEWAAMAAASFAVCYGRIKSNLDNKARYALGRSRKFPFGSCPCFRHRTQTFTQCARSRVQSGCQSSCIVSPGSQLDPPLAHPHFHPLILIWSFLPVAMSTYSY